MIRHITLTEEMRAALRKTVEAHKYGHGHALVLAGGVGHGGAARLAARAALRVGAGLVTLLPPQAAIPENAAQLTAVMLAALPDGYSLRGKLQDRRLNALLLGPGLGLPRAQEMVPAALWAKRATVLDADALSAFAADPGQLFAQLRQAQAHRGGASVHAMSCKRGGRAILGGARGLITSAFSNPLARP